MSLTKREQRQDARQALIDAVTFWRHATCSHISFAQSSDPCYSEHGAEHHGDLCELRVTAKNLLEAHIACEELRAIDGLATFEGP